jgi:hypothetical protein
MLVLRKQEGNKKLASHVEMTIKPISSTCLTNGTGISPAIPLSSSTVFLVAWIVYSVRLGTLFERLLVVSESLAWRKHPLTQEFKPIHDKLTVGSLFLLRLSHPKEKRADVRSSAGDTAMKRIVQNPI